MPSTACFALAHDGKEKEARAQIQLSLQARQAALSTAVARLLVQNSENEEQAAQRIVADLRSRAAAGLCFSGRDACWRFC